MVHHEPCGKNEIWVGNTHRAEARIKFFSDKGLKTTRLGKQAFDIYGKPLPSNYLPIFIDRNESGHHNAIMMEATFGSN